MPAIAMSDADLVYAKGMFSWPGGAARAACGKAGVHSDKREGDHTSPAGTFPLLRAFYRSDRLASPKTALPLAALTARDGWCDDPADPRYNTQVTLPYPASHEELWRADGLYDVIVVIGYNSDPIVAGKGSAVFLHCASPDFAGTEGCIAVARDTLVEVLALLGPRSRIVIKA